MRTIQFNTDMTLESLAFISDSKLRQILKEILSEINNIALIGAARSTLYLSMSTLEGILTHLIKINESNAKQYFPDKGKKGQKKLDELVFEDKINIAKKLKFIEDEYYEIFKKMKKFRNYMHPDVELQAGDQIDLGASQISLGILNHILNTLGGLRFIKGNVWKVISGEPIHESSLETIEFKRSNIRTNSFIVTEDFTGKDINVEFSLTLPGNCLLNFVYNFESDSKFNMLRFDTRGGRGNGSGFLKCEHYAEWDYEANFNGKPNTNTPNKVEIRCLDKEFIIKLNNNEINLTDIKYTKYDKKKGIGFFNEISSLTVDKLKISHI